MPQLRESISCALGADRSRCDSGLNLDLNLNLCADRGGCNAVRRQPDVQWQPEQSQPEWPAQPAQHHIYGQKCPGQQSPRPGSSRHRRGPRCRWALSTIIGIDDSIIPYPRGLNRVKFSRVQGSSCSHHLLGQRWYQGATLPARVPPLPEVPPMQVGIFCGVLSICGIHVVGLWAQLTTLSSPCVLSCGNMQRTPSKPCTAWELYLSLPQSPRLSAAYSPERSRACRLS